MANLKFNDQPAMFEYIFFNTALRDKFVNHAQQHGVACTTTEDHLGMVVAIPEDLAEAVEEELENYYDILESEQEVLSKSEGDVNQLAGFHFNLPDGQSRLLPVEPEIANRLMANFSLEEIQHLLEDVAHCSLFPNNEHLCKILAARKKNS